MTSSAAKLAPFEQAAGRIRADIQAGRLKPGDKLPPHREVATNYGIALGTTQKAFRLLEEEGWVIARPSIGVFVADLQDRKEPLTLSGLERQVSELRETVAALQAEVEGLKAGEGN